MRKHISKNSLVAGIIFLLICSSFVSSISGYSKVNVQENVNIKNSYKSQEKVVASCQTYGIPRKSLIQTEMSKTEAEEILDKINDIAEIIANDPLSDKTEKMQDEIFSLAKEYGLLSKDYSLKDFQPRFFSSIERMQPKKGITPVVGNRGTASFCNFATAGEGSQFPIIILPRMIPILLTPIPRAFLHWSSNIGGTTCGSYLTGTGFIASGMQRGTAFGFWGIGFSVFLPPIMAYGFIGYALFATCTAEIMEPWPPNYTPEVSAVSPIDGAENVAISTSELSFQISDENGDKMDYTVTTNPDIGTGSENNKPGGTYSIPISGLEGTEEYTWIVEVSDGQKTVEESFTFTTEPVAPVVSDPLPSDGARHVHIPISHLKFQIKDPQDDLMDYTIETSPDIGSDSAIGVSEGEYTLHVSGVGYSTDYRWYVNVTDGVNWKHKIFSFTTEEKPFDPFENGWQYRKKISINYTKVAEDLSNFPVLINVVDTDLRDKAQGDGDDILFMEKSGISRRLFHEIEKFDYSTGELIAWTSVTSLNSSEDTIFWLYYGNPDCENQETIEDVWDSHYIMVQHLEEVGSSDREDSTQYQNDGVCFGNTDSTDGIIGDGSVLDGNADYIRVSHQENQHLTDWTISLWFKPDVVTESVGIVSKGNQESDYRNYLLGITLSRLYGVYENNFGKDSNTVLSSYNLNTIDWCYTAFTYSNHLSRLFLNGIINDEKTQTIDPETSQTSDLLIGEYSAGGWSDYDGIIDEIRISNTVRDSSWISTSYNNQNEPQGFLSFGPEETGP